MYDEAKVKCVEFFNDDIARHPILTPAGSDAKPSVMLFGQQTCRPTGRLSEAVARENAGVVILCLSEASEPIRGNAVCRSHDTNNVVPD